MSRSGPGRTFSTGLSFLDRRLDGGIPVGGLLAITAPPASQSELLLRKLAAQRETRYVSTTCPNEDELRERFDHAGEVSVAHETPADVLDSPESLADRIPSESFFVLDGVTGLETADRDRYLAVLNAVKARLREQESAAVLHCPRAERDLPQRWLTLERCDHIWRLEVKTGPQDITYRLLLTKARGQQVIETPLPLELGETVDIDTSRSI